MLAVYYAGPLVLVVAVFLVLFEGSEYRAEACGVVPRLKQEQDSITSILTCRDVALMDAVRAKDIDGIASMYDGNHPLDPAILYQPTPGQVVIGQSSIKTEWSNLFEKHPTAIISETTESIGGNEALGQGFTTGSTTMTHNGFEVLL